VLGRAFFSAPANGRVRIAKRTIGHEVEDCDSSG
jgi:hypothetical protein